MRSPTITAAVRLITCAPRGLPRRRGLLRRERDGGYSVLEAAITLPAMILLTMVIVQWAIVWHARHVVQAAAQQALRAAEAYQSSAAAGHADGINFLHQVAPHALLNPSISVQRSPTNVTVHVHATVKSVIPFGSFAADATAAGPVEIFVSPP